MASSISASSSSSSSISSAITTDSTSSPVTTEKCSSNWTAKQNKLFEIAIVTYGEDTPNRWELVAKVVGGKTEKELKIHYNKLLNDIALIESGVIPLPEYVEQKPETPTPEPEK